MNTNLLSTDLCFNNNNNIPNINKIGSIKYTISYPIKIERLFPKNRQLVKVVAPTTVTNIEIDLAQDTYLESDTKAFGNLSLYTFQGSSCRFFFLGDLFVHLFIATTSGSLRISARVISEYSEKNMVQTLESIKGGGGSIKVGTTGKVSALMSRELDLKTSASPTPVSRRNKSPTVCSFSIGGATSPKRLKPRTSLDEASSSWASEDNQKGPEIVRKVKHYNCRTPQIPILESDNISVDGTPIRQKPDRKGPTLVEIVDITCGSTEKTRPTPKKNRLKKLGFSKLSGSPF